MYYMCNPYYCVTRSVVYCARNAVCSIFTGFGGVGPRGHWLLTEGVCRGLTVLTLFFYRRTFTVRRERVCRGSAVLVLKLGALGVQFVAESPGLLH